MAPITTSYVYPPIPDRRFDWCAYRDPEMRPYGWGATEAEAVANLTEWEAAVSKIFPSLTSR